MQVKLDAAQQLAIERERELYRRDQTVDDLRERLDKAERERTDAQTKLTAILTDQRLIIPAVKPARPIVQDHAALVPIVVLFAIVIWSIIQF